MKEEEFESTRRRMQRLIEDVASLESGESERALSFNAKRAVQDPRLIELLELKRDIEYRLFKAEEERDRERDRAEKLENEVSALREETSGAHERALEEAKTARTELAQERERREYLEKRLLTLEREHSGARDLFESEAQRLRDSNDALEAETKGLRLSRREEQEHLQGQIRDLEARYWKAQAEWEGERSRLETLLKQSENKNRQLEDSVNALGAFEIRCRELEDQLRGGTKSAEAAELHSAEDTVLPPVDPVLDPAWKRVAQFLEKPMATAYGHLKRFSGARLGDGHRALLKMTAGEIVRAQDALKALRHLLEADEEPVEAGRPEKVIEAVLAAWEPPLRRRGVTVMRRIDPTPAPGLRFAPEALRTAVYHILQNAYEAMPHGGNLTVFSEKAGAAGEIAFRFQDTGPGFTPDRLSDPFTPFRTKRENRLGIGLAIASAAMHAGSGEAEVENGKEGGAVISLRFCPHRSDVDDIPPLTGDSPVA